MPVVIAVYYVQSAMLGYWSCIADTRHSVVLLLYLATVHSSHSVQYVMYCKIHTSTLCHHMDYVGWCLAVL